MKKKWWILLVFLFVIFILLNAFLSGDFYHMLWLIVFILPLFVPNLKENLIQNKDLAIMSRELGRINIEVPIDEIKINVPDSIYDELSSIVNRNLEVEDEEKRLVK